jgi:hypothetical protein
MVRMVLFGSLIALGPLLGGCTNPRQPRNCSPEVGGRLLAPDTGDRPATRDAAGDYVCE